MRDRSRRGILDIDLVALVKAVPPPARFWVLTTLAACAGWYLSHQVGAVDAKLEAHKTEHAQQAEKLDLALNEIHAQLLQSVAQIPALQVQASDAKQQADRANTRLDGAERDPAYAGKR